MTTRSRYRNTMLEFFDNQTHERTAIVGAPVTFYEDFMGSALSTGVGSFIAIDQSTSTGGAPAIRANVANGVARILVHSTGSTGNNQESGLSFGDQLPFDVDQGLVFEARVAMPEAPTTPTQMFWGVMSAKSTTVDAATVMAGFRMSSTSTGGVFVETDDNATNTDDVATTTTLSTDGTFKIFRIDMTDTADVKFYIDGAEVASTTTFSIAASTVGVQPLLYVVKATASTGVGILDVDYVRVWQKRAS